MHIVTAAMVARDGDLGDRRMKRRTTEEVIREITKFLNGIGGAYDWDDFLSIPIHDQRLNAIRIECRELPDKNPPGAADSTVATKA
jgi:hypothetical protein